jgi:hypothetical protein
LRELDEPLVPWAWGINGCASVISAALATVLAVDFGFNVVLWTALVLYVVVLAAFPKDGGLKSIDSPGMPGAVS